MSTQSSQNIAAGFQFLTQVERVVLVFDASPSMESKDYPPTRLEAAKQAALIFLDRKRGFDERDEVAIVTFSGRVRTHSPLMPVGHTRGNLESAIIGLGVGAWDAGTAIGEALKEAAKVLGYDLNNMPTIGFNPGYVSRIILLSDGENNQGADPLDIANKLKSAGVFIDAVGIGKSGIGARKDWTGLNEKALEAIASQGRYKYMADSASLQKHYDDLAAKILSSTTAVLASAGSTGAPTAVSPETALSGATTAVSANSVLRGTSAKKRTSKQSKPNIFARIGPAIGSLFFRMRYVRRVKAGSPYIGAYCFNENNEATKFREGDLIVICPKSRHHVHHADCWVANNCHCYGKGIQCSGKGLLPARYLTK